MVTLPYKSLEVLNKMASTKNSANIRGLIKVFSIIDLMFSILYISVVYFPSYMHSALISMYCHEVIGLRFTLHIMVEHSVIDYIITIGIV